MDEPRQLNIFKGRRQLGERLPPISESKFHISLVSTIRLTIVSGWSFTHFASGEHRDKRTAAKLKAMGTAPGFPDLVFFGPDCRVFFLELKREGGRMSEAQKNVRFALQLACFDYALADRYADAVAMLNDRGIIRCKVSA